MENYENKLYWRMKKHGKKKTPLQNSKQTKNMRIDNFKLDQSVLKYLYWKYKYMKCNDNSRIAIG
jgi:hypothetical protein